MSVEVWVPSAIPSVIMWVVVMSVPIVASPISGIVPRVIITPVAAVIPWVVPSACIVWVIPSSIAPWRVTP